MGEDAVAGPAPAAQARAQPADTAADDAPLWQDASQRYRGALRGFFAKRVRDPTEVEDLTQEVFLHLIRRARGGPIEHVEQYIFQVAANALRDWGRRRQVRHQDAHESFDAVAHPLVTDISPERVLMGEEAIGLVEATLRGLPERTRDVFVLRVLDKRRYAEIATMMGISVRAAEKHMARALAQLGRAVDQAGGLE